VLCWLSTSAIGGLFSAPHNYTKDPEINLPVGRQVKDEMRKGFRKDNQWEWGMALTYFHQLL
jgi:hypothetical protein